MSEQAHRLREAVIERVVRGSGTSTAAQREAAFTAEGVDPRARPLIDKVAQHAYKTTSEDVAAAKAAGLTEDQIFELVVSAALGQATRQLEAATAALDAAFADAPAGAAS
ncbi:MAG: hypothetical protein IPQ07_26940 [Myxococcales bacterium]|nr:hypothetical protein [Myxococcales bacterium]